MKAAAPPPPKQTPATVAKAPLCQGKVVVYEEKTQCGFIKGFDGNGYGFSMAEWKNEHEKPRVEMIVNFEVREHEKVKEAVRIKIR